MPDFDPSQPFSVVDAALLGILPEKPSAIDLAVAPAIPKPAAVPVPAASPEFDPAQPFTPVPTGPTPTFDPKADFQKAFTLDDLKAKSLDELDREKDFEPTDFGFQYEDALNADPEAKAKLLELYKIRNQPLHQTRRFLNQSPAEIAKQTLVGAVHAPGKIIGGAWHVGSDIAKGVWNVAQHAGGAFLGVGAAGVHALTGASPKTINEDLAFAGIQGAELTAGLEAESTSEAGLLGRGVRAVGEAAAGLDPTGFVRDVTGVKPVSEMTPQELQARFANDVAEKHAVQDATRGTGEMLRALIGSSDELKQAGIEIDPAAVEKLMPATSLLNFIPLGEGLAVGAVGKVGGRFVVEKVAQAATKEQASLFIRGVNEGAELAGRATAATGAGLERAGGALRENVFKPLHDLGNVGSVIAAAGGHIGLGAGIAGVAKLSSKALELTGRGVKATAPFVATGVRIAADSAIEAGKGYAHGLLYTLPFMVGATPTEQEGLLNVAGLAGAVRGGVRATGLTGQVLGLKVQEALAGKIFEHVKQSKPPEVPDYGTDLTLDSQARVNVGNLSEPQKNFLGWAKHAFKDSGVEFYPVTDAQFLQQTGGQGGRGFAVKLGQTLAPDGSTKPLVRIFLNGDVDALPHEMLHALGNIDAPGYSDFVKTVNDSLTTSERSTFEQIYNTVQNSGLPQSKWKTRLTPEKLNEEIAAEIFSRVVLGQDLSGVKPTLTQKAALFASNLIEKLGVPLGDVNSAQAKDFKSKEAPRAGFSTLGVRPTAEATIVSRDFIQGLLNHLENNGDLLPGFQRPSLLKGGVVTGNPVLSRKPGAKVSTLVQPDLFKPAPPAPAPQPAPSVPTPLPSAPAPSPIPKPRNIRTTSSKQGDFAAQRHEQTKIDEAKATAEKIGNPDVVKHVEEISKALEGGTPIEIEYQSVKNEGGAEAPSGRGTRRTEQENAYIAEAMGALPADVRELAQKVTVPVRWETVAGKPQLIAMSLDKVIANVHKVAKEAAAHSVEAKIPYDIRKGTLTPEAWRGVVNDFQHYADNQANGYRGDGQKLNRPTEDIGISIPSENPDFSPRYLRPEKANFLNLVQGLKLPFTAREVKGSVPGNVKGQILAEINARTPQKPTVIRPGDIQKQTFKTSGRDIMEVNPLRNELAADGVPVNSLIEVTERLSTENIVKVTERPDINLKAPVTDTIRGGFLPGGEGGATAFIKRTTMDEIGRRVLDASPEEWRSLTSEIGGLTGAAYKVGNRLKDAGDVAKLRRFEAEATAQYEAAKATQDFDAMFPAATKKQFFTEALETATGMNPNKQAVIARILGPNWEPPFPVDASGVPPGGQPPAKPTAPAGSVGKGFLPAEPPRPDNTALALPVEGVDSPVKYAGEGDGLTPMRFLPGKAPGEKSTPASPSYPDADRLARERGGNAWVRQSPDASNKERVLLVQFTPELMYPNGPDPVSTPYYDKLYSGSRPGYTRATDFWELPQWVAVATENLGSKADFYAVRNMAEAKAFLEEADYGRVAFSVMDVSKAVTEELVPHIKGQVDLGGYTDRTGAVAKNPNAKIWNSMNEFIESMGIPYKKGFDYRHFRGTEIIPRLELSAGCRHRCTFCTIDRKVTNSPLEEINAQVDSFSGLNAKLVYLNDKTFGQSPNVAEMPRLYKEMKEANPEFEGFVIQTTAAQMKTFTDKFLQDSGIKYVELGVESYNDPILKELRKPATEKLIDEAVEKLRRNKINFIPNIVIGFPGETVATYGRTMDFLNRNSDVVSHLNTYNLAVYEGTEMSKKVAAKTAADADENSFNKSFYADPKIHEDFAKSLYDYGTQQLNQKQAFLPKVDDARAVQSAAIRNSETGEIFPGETHGAAMRKASLAEGIPFDLSVAYANPNYEQGFVTQGGDFLTREEAMNRVKEIGQIAPENLSRAGRFDSENKLESVGFQTFRKFLPGEKKISAEDFKKKTVIPGAIHAAAVRLDDGTIVTGAIHASAITAALERDPYYQGGFEDGFLTRDGKFLNRKEAQIRAEDIKQVPPGIGLAGALGYLESKEFDKNRKFLPAKRKSMEQEVADTDYSKYDVREKATPKASRPTGWILPNKTFVPLETAYHQQYLADNSDQLNKRFGTGFGKTANVEDRLAALNKGFVRVRYDEKSGRLHVEANSDYWNRLRPAILDHLQKNEGKIDAITISTLDREGQVVDSVNESHLMEYEGPKKFQILSEVVDAVRSGQRGQALPGGEETLPGLNLPSEERAKQLRVKSRVAKSRDKFPEALKLAYAKDDAGQFILGEDGKPKPKVEEYRFMDTPLAREAAHGLKGEDRIRAVEKALGQRLTIEAADALKNPELSAGTKWYSTARTRLKGLFGDDSKFFAELLGATSARTPVEVNYRFALDAYNQFKQGKFDKIIKKYREGKLRWLNADVKDFLKANPGNTDPTRGQFLDWWVIEHDLGPTQANGKKYGANSRQVLRVLDGSWAAETGGPKTPNFAGNLSGSTFAATVDVWAARALHRLANEGNEKPWRILPEMETGVTDEDFAIGQAAYAYAAKKLGMKPDSLQAVLWFAEKDKYERNGWTRGAGAQKSDFNVLLKETERGPGGTFKIKTPQMALDFQLKPGDLVSRKK